MFHVDKRPCCQAVWIHTFQNVWIQTCWHEFILNMFEFIRFKQYEFIPTLLNPYALKTYEFNMFEFIYVSKSMNSYCLTPWSLINTEHCAFGPEFWCFLLNFQTRAVNFNAWYWFYIQVEYQRLQGNKGAKERILGGCHRPWHYGRKHSLLNVAIC